MCDDTCKEVVADPANELLVCTISGRCFDRLLSPSEMDPEVARNCGFASECLQLFGPLSLVHNFKKVKDEMCQQVTLVDKSFQFSFPKVNNSSWLT